MNIDLQQILALLAYGFYLLIILIGGFVAVGAASLVRALVGLILTLLGVAGMYMLMAAYFIAIMQILIYVGAVTVLIFFAIMLTKGADGEAGSEESIKVDSRLVLAILTGALPSTILTMVFIKMSPEILPLKPETSLVQLGSFLAGPYVLAFELVSVVLFVAMAGAVLLGFERRKAK